MARALVAIGGNLGDRQAVLRSATAAIGRIAGTRVVRASRPIETPPERAADGPPFLNGALLLETALGPGELLRELLAVERRFGRRRAGGRHGGPRTLDLDLILFEGRAGRGPGLELPHPRFRGRRFVLQPAAEVAPGMLDPATGRTLAALLAAVDAREGGR